MTSIFDALAAVWRSVGDVFSDSSVGSPVVGCSASNCKTVSKKTKERLEAAQEAINYAKEKLPYGAGNQMNALNATNYNSKYRMDVARDENLFIIPPKVEELEGKNPAAFIAAKAELAKGGNCGEHAFVVYDYLRQKYPNEYIQVAQKEGFNHAFVFIGDPSVEGDNQIVVVDAWPTEPTPVLWEDHFAYTSDRKKILNHSSSKDDGHDYKQDMFDAGLSLNDEGSKVVETNLTNEETEKKYNRDLRMAGYGIIRIQLQLQQNMNMLQNSTAMTKGDVLIKVTPTIN